MSDLEDTAAAAEGGITDLGIEEEAGTRPEDPKSPLAKVTGQETPDPLSVSSRGEQEIIHEWLEIQKEKRELFRQQRAEMDPMYERKMKELEGLGDVREPELQQLPPPPDAQQTRRELTEGMQNFAGIAVAIAGFGALKTRQSATLAVQGLAAVANGAADGMEQRVKEGFEQWKYNAEQIVKNNETMVKEYKSKLENRKLRYDVMIEEMKLVATKWQSQIDMLALEQGDLVNFGKLLKGHEDAAIRTKMLLLQYDTRKLMQEYWQAKKQGGIAGESTLTDEAAKDLAYIMMRTGQIPTGLSRRGQDITKVYNSLPTVMRENNMTTEDYIKAQLLLRQFRKESDTLGLRSGGLGLSVAEAKSLITPALEHIEEVYRTTLIPINQAWINIAKGTASEKEAVLQVDLYELYNVFSTIARRGGLNTDQATERASQLLSQAQTPDQLRAVTNEMLNILEKISKAPAQASEDMMRRFDETKPGGPKGAQRLSPELQKWLKEANDAIAAHPDLPAVRQRLIEEGKKKGIPEESFGGR